MMDPSAFVGTTSSFFHTIGTNPLLSFADQGQNLAGIFFQSSLLPYLAFLYFLGFKGNRIPELGNFGFQFILFFVLATIPSGIISKSTYGFSLANVDFLHGGAELLLTISTLLIVSPCMDATDHYSGLSRSYITMFPSYLSTVSWFQRSIHRQSPEAG
jgi:hypothetical protein